MNQVTFPKFLNTAKIDKVENETNAISFSDGKYSKDKRNTPSKPYNIVRECDTLSDVLLT